MVTGDFEAQVDALWNALNDRSPNGLFEAKTSPPLTDLLLNTSLPSPSIQFAIERYKQIFLSE